MYKLIVVLICGLAFTPVYAVPLTIVNVSPPSINCIFDPSCRVVVTDTRDTIRLPTAGTNFLQSRTFRGQPGSQENGFYAYEYRIDLSNAYGITYIPCISSLTIEIGPVVSILDYNGDGIAGDQVYVVTGGGIGSIGLASADLVGNKITFTFSPPVCAGGRPGSGQSTFLFGLVSTQPPTPVTATVKESVGPVHNVQARAPLRQLVYVVSHLGPSGGGPTVS